MADQSRKRETIRSIENLQLSQHLVLALEDIRVAEEVAYAVSCLQHLSEQWN